MNQSRSKLINLLNTNHFRDMLFERFFNSKYYDIGLMGRKRLNKKLRLNIPLHCTALTPLDFLALFYKLFFLLNLKSPLNPVYKLLPDQKKSLYLQKEEELVVQNQNLDNHTDFNKYVQWKQLDNSKNESGFHSSRRLGAEI